MPDWRLAIPAPRRRRLRIWMWAIAAATTSVLVVGGITRLTHSGLSMVEWQPLLGVVPPLTESDWVHRFEQYKQFPEYQRLRRDMTLNEFKVIFFWEYLHRLLARMVGLVFLVPFVVFWRAGDLPPPLMRRVLVLFLCGAAQGVLGWLMVQSGLVDRPSVSHYRLAAHLTLAFVIFGLAVWVARDLSLTHVRAAVGLSTRALVRGALAWLGLLTVAQVVWGAFVAGLKAGLLFNTFPLMGGRLVPERLLALNPPAVNFVENVVAVQWMHRAIGTALLLSTALLVLALHARSDVDQSSRRFGRWLLALITAQYVLGIATLLWGVPISLAVSHQALALAIAGVWVGWVHHTSWLHSRQSSRAAWVPASPTGGSHVPSPCADSSASFPAPRST